MPFYPRLLTRAVCPRCTPGLWPFRGAVGRWGSLLVTWTRATPCPAHASPSEGFFFSFAKALTHATLCPAPVSSK